MDAILDKLTEIENAASAIVRHAEEQKDVLGQEFDEKRKHALRKSGNSWKKNSREFLTAAAAQVRIRSAASGKNMKRSIQNMRMRY